MSKSRVLISVLAIALAIALVGGATAALFSSTTESGENSFQAGTLVVEVGEEIYEAEGALNMAPGTCIEGSFMVENDGTLPLQFTVTPNPSGDLFGGTTPAVVSIIENGSGVLQPGENLTVSYRVCLPREADDTYQGATGTLSFTVDGNQVEEEQAELTTYSIIWTGNPLVGYYVITGEIEALDQDGNTFNLNGPKDCTFIVTASGSVSKPATITFVDGRATFELTGASAPGPVTGVAVRIDGVTYDGVKY